jgi:hypothetical protein
MSSKGKNSSTLSGKSSVSQTVGRSVFTVSSSFHFGSTGGRGPAEHAVLAAAH